MLQQNTSLPLSPPFSLQISLLFTFPFPPVINHSSPSNMSSTGVTLETPQPYFCYHCNRAVTITPLPNSDLFCPICNGGFLEEFDPPNPNPNPNHFSFSPLFADPFSLTGHPFFSPTFDLENPRNFSNFFPPSPSPGSAFNAFDFIQGYLHDMRARGTNVRIVLENHPSSLSSNLGDYFLGPALEQLMQQLAENNPNRYGTPPASKREIEGLPDVVITDEVVNSDSNSCAVCMNEFEVGSKAKQMPCKHLYHSDCLLPWLDLHNSCPVCRYELPTDDPDYENRRGSSGGDHRGSGNSGMQGGSPGFRISLPWPFSAFVSSGGNNDDGAGISNNSNSGSNRGAQQGGDHGSGLMDLD